MQHSSDAAFERGIRICECRQSTWCRASQIPMPPDMVNVHRPSKPLFTSLRTRQTARCRAPLSCFFLPRFLRFCLCRVPSTGRNAFLCVGQDMQPECSLVCWTFSRKRVLPLHNSSTWLLSFSLPLSLYEPFHAIWAAVEVSIRIQATTTGFSFSSQPITRLRYIRQQLPARILRFCTENYKSQPASRGAPPT